MRSTWLACLGLFVACSGSGFDSPNGDNLDGANVPPKGGKFFSIALPTSDSCGIADAEAFDLAVIDVKVSKKGKQLDFTEDDMETSCAADGAGGFDCLATVEFGPPVMRTKIERRLALRFESTDRIEAAFEITISCTGAKCAGEGEDSPPELSCSAKGDLIAVRTMPESFVPETGEYDATVGTPVLSTCKPALDVPPEQELDIEPTGDGEAIVIVNGDTENPFACMFEGDGRATCSRQTSAGGRSLQSLVDVAWTSATTFEGTAAVEVDCADGADCSGSELGELPCFAGYHLRGSARR